MQLGFRLSGSCLSINQPTNVVEIVYRLSVCIKVRQKKTTPNKKEGGYFLSSLQTLQREKSIFSIAPPTPLEPAAKLIAYFADIFR